MWSDDIQHHVSRAWLQSQVEAGTDLIAPYLLLSEATGAITRRTNNVDLGRAVWRYIEIRLGISLLILDAAQWAKSAELAIELQLKGADAVYVAVAEYYKAPLITWDIEQRDRGGQRVTTLSPAPSGPIF